MGPFQNWKFKLFLNLGIIIESLIRFFRIFNQINLIFNQLLIFNQINCIKKQWNIRYRIW